MRWIRFTVNYQVQATGGPFYKANEVVQLSGSSANHFLRRGVAVPCDAPDPPKPPPPPPPVMEEPDVEEKPVAETPKPKKRYRRKKK